jgi:riboflavin biosynthesis pyrimidine reductase
VSLREALETLWRDGVRRLVLEAGPTLLDAFFEAGFVDQVAVYSGSVNGGEGPSLAPRLTSDRLSQPARRDVGADSVLEAFVRG